MVSSEPDLRKLPDGRDPSGSTVLLPYGGPRKYHASLKYDFGARARLSEVLKGKLSASVRVKFAFFSKRWSQVVAEYAGLKAKSPNGGKDSERYFFDQQLFGVEASSGIDAASDWGDVQMPMPFPVLDRLAEPAAPSAPVSTVNFEATRVENLFYDQQCSACVKQGESYTPGWKCCKGLVPRYLAKGDEGYVDPADGGTGTPDAGLRLRVIRCLPPLPPRCALVDQTWSADVPCCEGLMRQQTTCEVLLR